MARLLRVDISDFLQSESHTQRGGHFTSDSPGGSSGSRPLREAVGDQGCGVLGRRGQIGFEGKPISYTTSGGYKVSIDGTTINVTDPNGKNTVKTWGDPHENVNGTHVKDWEGKQRSIVLEDGTKITMTADGPKGVVENTSIYDGNQSVQITNKGNQITGHTFDPRQTAYLDASQYDGETALFSTGYNGAATYANIYNQDSSFNVTRAYQAIATTGGYANPNQVNDLYKG